MNIFRKSIYILPVLLAAAISTGCAEEELYERGQGDNADNYGVYFPNQTATTRIDISSADPREIKYKVRRTNGTEAIVVPVKVSATKEDDVAIDPDEIFEIEDIVFGPGETETEFKVSFPDVEMGVRYSCSISIEDTRYISIYGTRSTNLSFSVICADWKQVIGPNGETTGKWRDEIFSDVYMVDVEGFNPYPEVEMPIYEREGAEGYYRMKVYGEDLLKALVGGQNLSFTGRDLWTEVDATDPNKVYIPYQSTGITLVTEDGELSIGSEVPENFQIDESTAQYGTLEDNIITFPPQSILVEFSGNSGMFGSANLQGMLRIMLPGAVEKDYSVTLTGHESSGGVVKVDASFGNDVTKFRYKVYEGALDAGAASLQAQELDAAKDSGDKEIKVIDVEENKYTIEIKDLEETAKKYTLIGCVYDETDSMQDYEYVTFGYLKNDGDKDFILDFGLELTDEYKGQGLTKENSTKFWAYGEEIESVTYGLFWKRRVDGFDNAKLNEVLDEQGISFTSSQLVNLNDGHFSVMFDGLNGDNDYVLILRASNGFQTKLMTKEIHTEGVFNPGLEVYYYEDFLDEQPTQEKLKSTKWNYYAVNLADMDNVNLERKKIGQVEFKDYYVEGGEGSYFSIKGMGGIEFESGGEMIGFYMPTSSQGYKGAVELGSISPDTDGVYNGETVIYGFVPDDGSMSIYNGSYFMYLGAVDDGYLYCVPSQSFLAQYGYNFTYLFVGSTNTLYGLYMDMMLVDPAVDMNKDSATSAAIERMAAIRSKAVKGFTPGNYVELPEFSMNPGGGVVDTDMPVNLVSDPMPASAPALRPASCNVQVYPASRASSGTGAVTRIDVKTKSL